MTKKLLLATVTLIILFFSSCSKDDDVIDRLSPPDDIPANADLSIDTYQLIYLKSL